MAQDIHPQMRKVTYKFSKNRSLQIMSNYKNLEFLLETDIFNHSAWREDDKVVNTGSAKVSQFNASFGGSSPLGSFAPLNLAEEVQVSKPKKAPTAKKATKSTAKEEESVASEENNA